MILPILAAVTVDANTQAAAPWVEQVVGALVLSTLGAIGWLIKNALKKMTEDAVAREQQKGAEEKRTELSSGLTALKNALDAQKNHCSECHQNVDVRLARGDTAIELLRNDMAHVLASVAEMKGMLSEFINRERERRRAAGHQDTDPRMLLPRGDEG